MHCWHRDFMMLEALLIAHNDVSFVVHSGEYTAR